MEIKEKKMENQRNQQGEMVDNQTANKTNKHLKKRKKNSWFRNSTISVLVVLVLLLQHPVLFVCLFAHLLVCISQPGLELASGSAGALLFPQCNTAWRSLLRAGVQGFAVLFLHFFFFQVWLQQESILFGLLKFS
jgi:hypothetical protein